MKVDLSFSLLPLSHFTPMPAMTNQTLNLSYSFYNPIPARPYLRLQMLTPKSIFLLSDYFQDSPPCQTSASPLPGQTKLTLFPAPPTIWTVKTVSGNSSPVGRWPTSWRRWRGSGGRWTESRKSQKSQTDQWRDITPGYPIVSPERLCCWWLVHSGGTGPETAQLADNFSLILLICTIFVSLFILVMFVRLGP